MSNAQRIQLGFISCALLYALVGNYSWYRAQTEYFPIYSWDLFSSIPSHSAMFAVRLTHINGKPLDPPRYFNEATAYIPAAKSIDAFALIQRFGRAIYEGDAGAAGLRAQFEAHYLDSGDDITYELVIRAYDPLQFSRTGSADELTHLQTFQHQEREGSQE